MATLQIEFPEDLAKQLDILIAQGWVTDRREAVVEALKRFLDVRRPELMKSQLLADVAWGLDGAE